MEDHISALIFCIVNYRFPIAVAWKLGCVKLDIRSERFIIGKDLEVIL